jgi:hypothetical protein
MDTDIEAETDWAWSIDPCITWGQVWNWHRNTWSPWCWWVFSSALYLLWFCISVNIITSFFFCNILLFTLLDNVSSHALFVFLFPCMCGEGRYVSSPRGQSNGGGVHACCQHFCSWENLETFPGLLLVEVRLVFQTVHSGDKTVSSGFDMR